MSVVAHRPWFCVEKARNVARRLWILAPGQQPIEMSVLRPGFSHAVRMSAPKTTHHMNKIKIIKSINLLSAHRSLGACGPVQSVGRAGSSHDQAVVVWKHHRSCFVEISHQKVWSDEEDEKKPPKHDLKRWFSHKGRRSNEKQGGGAE